MRNKAITWSVRHLIVPVAMLTFTGCAAIEAQKLAGDGARLSEKGQYDQAVEVYKQSLAKSDNDGAHSGLAEIYLRRGQYGDAEVAAQKAIEAAGESGMSYTSYRYHLQLSRAQLLQGRGPEAYESANKVVTSLSGAAVDASQALLIKQILKEGLLVQARIVEATGNPADALKIVEDADVQLRYPNNLDFLAESAIVAALEGNYEQALSKADTVLAAHPEDGDAKLAKGIVLAFTGKTGSTKEVLAGALEEDHTRALVFMRVPEKLRTQNKPDEALKVLELLAAVQPDNPTVQMNLAFTYLTLQKWDESVASHEKALRFSPSLKSYHAAATPDALVKLIKDQPPSEFDRSNLEGMYQNLAVLYRNKKDLSKAAEYLTRAIAVNPALSSYQDLAITYQQLGERDKAISTMETVVKLDPNNVDVLKSLGQMLIETDLARSREYYDKARKLKPEDADVLLGLGVGMYNAKQYEGARKEFEEAVKLLPNNADVVYYLALAQLNSGQKDNAEANLKKVTELKVDYADAYKELGNLARDRKNFKLMEKYYNLEDKYRQKK